MPMLFVFSAIDATSNPKKSPKIESEDFADILLFLSGEDALYDSPTVVVDSINCFKAQKEILGCGFEINYVCGFSESDNIWINDEVKMIRSPGTSPSINMLTYLHDENLGSSNIEIVESLFDAPDAKLIKFSCDTITIIE